MWTRWLSMLRTWGLRRVDRMQRDDPRLTWEMVAVIGAFLLYVAYQIGRMG